MNDTANYPLQSNLQVMLTGVGFMLKSTTASPQDRMLLNNISNKTIDSAQKFIGSIPIIMVYPFLQKHFAKGLVLGSLKG